MNSCRNNYLWSTDFEWSLVVRKKTLNSFLFFLFAIFNVSYCQKIEISSFVGGTQHLVVKVDIGMKRVFLCHFFDEILTVSI